MNNIEQQLWSYIDGFCTPEEQQSIAGLIAHDEVYRRKYNELLQLNKEFAGMELDEPSMAFTYRVMETIGTEHSRQPLKAAINKRIIWGIAFFFLITITALVLFSLSNVQFPAAGNTAFDLKFSHQPDFSPLKSFFSAPVLKIFLFFDVITGLFLFDGYIRNKSQVKHS